MRKKSPDDYNPPTWSKQQMREYRRKRKATRKKMIKEAKEYHPWDFGYILNFIDTALEDMEEYYSTGVNVVQVDESRLEIVKQLGEARTKLAAYYDSECTLEGNPDEKLKEFFASLGEHFTCWWD